MIRAHIKKIAILASSIAVIVSVRPSSAQMHHSGIPFENQPHACECFPTDPASKKYIAEGKRLGYHWRTFSCDFTCISPTGETTLINGTETRGYWLIEEGNEFVCRGFRMSSMDTPLGDRMSVMVIKNVRPFTAANSKIGEIVSWSRDVGCH